MPVLYFLSEFEDNITLSAMAYEAGGMSLDSQPFRIENFTYKNDIVMKTIFKHLEGTNFTGVSVK